MMLTFDILLARGVKDQTSVQKEMTVDEPKTQRQEPYRGRHSLHFAFNYLTKGFWDAS